MSTDVAARNVTLGVCLFIQLIGSLFFAGGSWKRGVDCASLFFCKSLCRFLNTIQRYSPKTNGAYPKKGNLNIE